MPSDSTGFPDIPAPDSRILAPWLSAQRWFRSKSRSLESVAIEAAAPLGAAPGDAVFAVARATFRDGSRERYALPLALKTPAESETLPPTERIGSAAAGAAGTPESVWCDASRDPSFHAALYRLLEGSLELKLGGGVLRGAPLSPEALRANGIPSARVLSAEQSNTSFAYANGFFAKLYRRLEAAVNPEPETLRALRATGYAHVPAFASTLEWTVDGQAPVTVALLQAWVSSRGDAWAYALEQLAAARDAETLPDALTAWAAALGRRVAGLHNALAAAGGDAFAPEPLAPEDVERLRAGTRASLDEAIAALQAALPRLDARAAALARDLVERRADLHARVDAAAREAVGAVRIRTHGDLHLGQILVADDDPERVWILDFEGEPGRPLAEARRKHPPARDAAGMLRSFHYAAHFALRDPALRARAEAFAAALGGAFQGAYGQALRVPASAHPERLLEMFTLEKAVYELNYELNNRPDWADIPLLGLQHLVTNPGDPARRAES